MTFDADRYLVDQLIRPVANLYRITPLGPGETPLGPPVAFVRQKKLSLKEDIRFYADESQEQELFRIKARSMFDMGGARYDVFEGEQRIGLLWHKFGESILRTTWHVGGPDEQEVALARERSQFGGILRRVLRFVPYAEYVPIPYNFEILVGGRPIGGMNRKFKLRDQYVLDLSGDAERALDRRLAIALAIALDTLQNR